MDGVPQLSLEEAMREDNDIQAVIISTENARHEELARLVFYHSSVNDYHSESCTEEITLQSHFKQEKSY